jgi:arylsulfatase A-like enzyme
LPICSQAVSQITRRFIITISAEREFPKMRCLVVIVCLLAIGLFGGQAVNAAEKPNILLIVGDDMGYADVGFHGCKDIPTPHLDALAKSGAQYTSGYVTGPYCSPTRAGLLTGRYQQRFGHEFNPSGGKAGLPVTETTIADRLKQAGYATGLVGKWHLGSNEAMHPQARGFDEFFGFLGGAHSFFDAAGIMRGKEPVKELAYTTDAFGREASTFVERHQGKPWFLYLAFNAVHTPMHATDDRLAKFANVADKQRRTYNAMMLAMDDAIGVVLKKLAATGQDKNTLVMFISDNGGPTMPGVTVNGSVNLPLAWIEANDVGRRDSSSVCRVVAGASETSRGPYASDSARSHCHGARGRGRRVEREDRGSEFVALPGGRQERFAARCALLAIWQANGGSLRETTNWCVTTRTRIR